MSWRLAASICAAYAVALLVLAPAGMLDLGLDGVSGGRLRLLEADGSLWSGAGRLEMRTAGGRALVAQGLRWYWLPTHLTQGRLAFELQLDYGERPFVLSLGVGQMDLTGLAVSLPAKVLGALQAKLSPLQLSGDVVLGVKEMAVTRAGWSGSATLHWRHAGSALTPVFPLGDYELHLLGEGAMTRIKLVTLQGPLQLDGAGSLIHEGKLAFSATARITAEFRSQLAPLMRLIAVERGDGSFEIQLG